MYFEVKVKVDSSTLQILTDRNSVLLVRLVPSSFKFASVLGSVAYSVLFGTGN